jgi:hypothetical protein
MSGHQPEHSIQQAPDFLRERPAAPTPLKILLQHLSLRRLATIGVRATTRGIIPRTGRPVAHLRRRTVPPP